MTYQLFLSQLSFCPATVHGEIETWKKVYGIDKHYEDKCCRSDAKGWLEQVRILRDALAIDGSHRITSNSVYSVVWSSRVFRGSSWKKAFLEARNRGKTVLHTRKRGRLE